jgi:uncharacterized membrane protein
MQTVQPQVSPLTQPDQYTSYSTQTVPIQDTGILHHMSAALSDSVNRVLALLVSILPGLLAFILAVAILTAVGVFLSWGLRKLLTSMKFDERMARSNNSGISDWSPNHSPSVLIGRTAFWVCVVLGLIIGIFSLDASYSSNGSYLSASLLPYLTRSVGAILILFAGNLIARFLARTVLIGAVNNQLQYARFLSIGVKWLVLVLTAAMTLDHLQVGGNVVELAFGILFGGIVLTLAIAIGLGSRDLVSRSLEAVTDKSPATSPTPLQVNHKQEEALRHF